MNWGGNFLLGEAAKISCTESLNVSVAAKLRQQAMTCSENHRSFKARERTKRQFSPYLHPHVRLGSLWLCLEIVWPTSMKNSWRAKPDSRQEAACVSQTTFCSSQGAEGTALSGPRQRRTGLNLSILDFLRCRSRACGHMQRGVGSGSGLEYDMPSVHFLPRGQGPGPEP